MANDSCSNLVHGKTIVKLIEAVVDAKEAPTLNFRVMNETSLTNNFSRR